MPGSLSFLKILKILGISFGVLALFALICGALAIFLTRKIPPKFNELVFPPAKRKDGKE